MKTVFSALKFAILGTIIIAGINRAVYAGGSPLAGMLEHTKYTFEEKESLMNLYDFAVQEGYVDRIIYKKLSEAVSREVPYETLYGVIERDINKIIRIKAFCIASMVTKTPVKCSGSSIKSLMGAFDDGLSFEWIQNFHQLAVSYGRKKKEFLYLVDAAAKLQVSNIPIGPMREIAGVAYNAGKPFSYLKKVVSMYERSRIETSDSAARIIIQGIKKEKDLTDIWCELQDLKLFRSEGNRLR